MLNNSDIGKIRKLLSINSHSHNAPDVNRTVDEWLNWFNDAELEIDWERIPHQQFGDFVIGRTTINPDLPVIGLVVHTDTVYESNKQFDIRVSDGKLYGPGAQDMQTSLFVVYKALVQLAAERQLQNIVIIANSCEEQGSPAFQSTVRSLANELDYALVYECAYEIGERHDPHRLQLVASRKGALKMTIRVNGPGGHTGQIVDPDKRLNAITQASKIVVDLENLADYEKETTIGILHINGGRDNTVLAEDCEVTFDARFRIPQERKRIKDAVQEIMQRHQRPGMNIEILSTAFDLPALPRNNQTQQFTELVTEVAAATDIRVMAADRGGWSDACNLYSYNPQLHVLDGFGPQGDGEHTIGEYVYLDSVPVSIDLTKAVIERLLHV